MSRTRKNLLLLTVIFAVLINTFGHYSLVYAYGSSKSNTENHTQSYEREKNEILVKFKDEKKSNDIKEAVKKKLKLNKMNLKKEIKFSNNKGTEKDKTVELLELGNEVDINQVVDEFKRNTDVEYVQPNYKLYTNTVPSDIKFNEQWALYNIGQAINSQIGVQGIDINIVKAWDITLGSQDVIVGILDTGIDINHEDLRDNIYVNLNEIPNNGIDDDNNGYVDDISGWDFFNQDNLVYDSYDLDNHGTHVAGIVAAKSNELGISGVAPNVKVLPLKFINGEYGYTSDAIEAIEYAKTIGIKIINCSWGSPNYNYALKETIDNSDILFICAAGNYGQDVNLNPIYPACFNSENIISVGAINNKGELAYFSNYGEGIDIAAPGVDILSTVPENEYKMMSGTSMAAPHVTGVAALMLSIDSDGQVNDLKNKIIENVTPIETLIDQVNTSGIINGYNSLVNNRAYILDGDETQDSIITIEDDETNNQSESSTTQPSLIHPIDPPPRGYYYNVVINSLTSDKSSPQIVGTNIKWTCNAEVIESEYAMSLGCNDNSLITDNNEIQVLPIVINYNWEVYKGTQLVYSCSTGTSNVFIWTPNEIGDYKIEVTATAEIERSSPGVKTSNIFRIYSVFIYEYDKSNRLINISKQSGEIIYSFEYDDNGNLLKIIKY